MTKPDSKGGDSQRRSSSGEPAPRGVGTDAGSAKRALRVLVVEDNVDSAESLQLVLILGGHQVAVAHTGSAGVEQARAFQPEIVLCDIGLPGEMNGYAVAQTLRKDPATGKAFLIALTGYGREEDQQRARQVGFDLHVTKPVDPMWLDQVLADLTTKIS